MALAREEDQLTGLLEVLEGGERFAFVKLTPSHLQMLGSGADLEKIGGKIGALVIGGEALKHGQLTEWRKRCPAVRLINEYRSDGDGGGMLRV